MEKYPYFVILLKYLKWVYSIYYKDTTLFSSLHTNFLGQKENAKHIQSSPPYDTG